MKKLKVIFYLKALRCNVFAVLSFEHMLFSINDSLKRLFKVQVSAAKVDTVVALT